MTRTLLVALTLTSTLALSPAAQAGSTKTIEGTVTEVDPASPGGRLHTDDHTDRIVVHTGKEGDVPVLTTSRTRYQKWVTRQPWQQSTRADASILRIGRRVSVQFRESGAARVATLIRVATE